ncbi:hypothetical protein ACQB6R_06055 [Propionibacteriaceae bacterium G1746]|uniref:hypothetical protein n=1 Tax=Aestuariimicrobium sp. G57 TaxID=3418485 RepID=UPI003C222FFD
MTTLSLADVARLAGVQRPVVSMWRRRPKSGLGFPTPTSDGRFDAAEVVDWLEATQRGNNPDPRADLAIQAVVGSSTDAALVQDLRLLLAARTMLDQPLAGMTFDDLLDETDELDPDDDYLYSDLEALGRDRFNQLAAQTDAIADAAWHPRHAFEQLTDTLAATGKAHDTRLAPELVDLLAASATALLSPAGTMVDLSGSCADVIIRQAGKEDIPTPTVTLAARQPSRDALLRYRTHDITPRHVTLDDDWALRAGDVVISRLPRTADTAFDLLDELALQLPAQTFGLIVGPAKLLTDSLPHDQVGRRDVHLRQQRVRAAVRLPQGLTRGGTREHLALWLMTPSDSSPTLWAGDLSGRAFDEPTRQNLLDDLLATTRDDRARAFLTLTRSNPARVLANGSSLVTQPLPQAQLLTGSAADDSARIQTLRAALNAPLPDVLPHDPVAVTETAPSTIRLGDALDQRLATLLSGTRLADLPSGTLRVWDADAVHSSDPRQVDLLALTRAHPHLQLTYPGDVVFTNHGRPRAIVDRAGGSAVAYPARIIRSTSETLVPEAIAEAINQLPPGNGKWRTWPLPVSTISRETADTLMQHLQNWESLLQQRQTQLHELRRLVTRSVLSGAITLSPTTQKGH